MVWLYISYEGKTVHDLVVISFVWSEKRGRFYYRIVSFFFFIHCLRHQFTVTHDTPFLFVLYSLFSLCNFSRLCVPTKVPPDPPTVHPLLPTFSFIPQVFSGDTLWLWILGLTPLPSSVYHENHYLYSPSSSSSTFLGFRPYTGRIGSLLFNYFDLPSTPSITLRL